MEYLGFGDIALAQEQFEEAREWLTRSLTQWREIGNRREIASNLAYLRLAERGLGRPALAWQHLEEALHTATETGSRPPALSALGGIAVLLADEGDVERAVELYAATARYPRIQASQFC
jgi:tetratricopeptide (TPR) repeat protein